jgi:hypothetical protein
VDIAPSIFKRRWQTVSCVGIGLLACRFRRHYAERKAIKFYYEGVES